MKKLQDNTNMNTRNQSTAIKNFETQIGKLTKDFQEKFAKEEPSTFTPIGHYKAIFTDDMLPCFDSCLNYTNKFLGISFVSDQNMQEIKKENPDTREEVSTHKLPLKEMNPGSFTLPYTIGSLNMYALADSGSSVNIMPFSIFKYLELTNLKETTMMVEMDDMSKKVPRRIEENFFVKINKFVVSTDFVLIDMVGDPHENLILEKVYMAETTQEEESSDLLGIDDDLLWYQSQNILEGL
ncbi:7-deoxyloganetin glucosyltransferase-like protein [Tanacetum coccineum]|uniref:7-deoxyloganetin glucosyltransferase-like protein n=1 Tax=Tanacetum coccineum TaxID=301880 RepID=A0ABQ5CIB0_9ASTR